MGVAVGLGDGVAVGSGVAVGLGVAVGAGGFVGWAVGLAVLVGLGCVVDVDVEVEVGVNGGPACTPGYGRAFLPLGPPTCVSTARVTEPRISAVASSPQPRLMRPPPAATAGSMASSLGRDAGHISASGAGSVACDARSRAGGGGASGWIGRIGSVGSSGG